MNATTVDGGAERRGPLDRLLGLFSDVQAGEGGRALLMLANVFLILVAYYIIKTVREPLILGTEVPGFLQRLGIKGPAEVKAYAAAGQALVLMAFVPAYSWFASRVDRMKLIVGVTLFFVANILAFAASVAAGMPFVGVAFYVWVGFFSLSIIAQFWSYANDIYTKEAGNRLFPVIGIGATAGSPVGAWIAGQLFGAHVSVMVMLFVAAGLLLASLVIYVLVNRETPGAKAAAAAGGAQATLGTGNGFSLVFANRYILLIAVLLVVLNVVNTIGEYVLSHLVVEHASALLAADASFDKNAYIGAYYGSYFFWVNVLAVLLQAFVASRLVKYCGLAGVLFALPVIALGAYGMVAIGADHRPRGVRGGGGGRDDGDRAVGEDGRELDRLLGDEHGQAAALAADDARGEVQGQAGGRQLLRTPGRSRRRLRGLRGHGLGDARRERLRDRQPLLRRRLARARVRARPLEPAAHLGEAGLERAVSGWTRRADLY
jgi:AAA family ATP:ADP antiporter